MQTVCCSVEMPQLLPEVISITYVPAIENETPRLALPGIHKLGFVGAPLNDPRPVAFQPVAGEIDHTRDGALHAGAIAPVL